MKYLLRAFIGLFCVLAVACGGQTGGFAPVSILPEPVKADISLQSTLKFGESAANTNNWEISLDTTDSVENITLANGWSMEVKYE